MYYARHRADMTSSIGDEMALIKAKDMAYGRMRSPDLDRDGGVPHPVRHDAGRAHADRALYARHRSGAPHPRHREGRSEIPGLCLLRGERGRPQAHCERARRQRHRNDRRARRRQARAADRAQRLPGRGGVRDRDARADPAQAAAEAQLRRRPAGARRRTDAAAEGAVAGEAHRPRRAQHAEIPRDRGLVSATRSASSAPTTSMPATSRT